MEANLTERRATILKFIVRNIRREGRAPSVREIMKASGLASTGAISYQLGKLAEDGFIKLSGHFRDITVLVNPLDESNVVPNTKLLWKMAGAGVPAGPLKPIPELVDGTASMDNAFFKSKKDEDLFFIRVAGDSMTGAGIDLGDWVVVRPQETAHHGDLIIAAVGNEITLKRFKLEKGEIVLESANPKYQPIRIPKDKAKEFRIIGRVIKAVKDFE